MAATTYDGGTFEVAATLEGDNIAAAKVIGNYNPRTTVYTATGTVSGNTFKLTNSSDVGRFKVNDTTNQ